MNTIVPPRARSARLEFQTIAFTALAAVRVLVVVLALVVGLFAVVAPMFPTSLLAFYSDLFY
jgi:hypothetical protein